MFVCLLMYIIIAPAVDNRPWLSASLDTATVTSNFYLWYGVAVYIQVLCRMGVLLLGCFEFSYILSYRLCVIFLIITFWEHLAPLSSSMYSHQFSATGEKQRKTKRDVQVGYHSVQPWRLDFYTAGLENLHWQYADLTSVNILKTVRWRDDKVVVMHVFL